LHYPAHSDYTIYSPSGMNLMRVLDATGPADTEPALVPLPSGRYQVEAQVETSGGGTANVMIPVVIQPGKITVLHLEDDWKSAGHY
jgi:hypothetical protein